MILILIVAMAALFIAMRLMHQGLPLFAMAIVIATLLCAWLLAAGKWWAGAGLALAVAALIRAACRALAQHDVSSQSQ